MNEAELRLHIPHAKRCMADKFDAMKGVQCDNTRDISYIGWFPWEGVIENRNPRVWICALHNTYRENGGTQLGPLMLRAAAEVLQSEKREKAKLRKASLSSPSSSSSSSPSPSTKS